MTNTIDHLEYCVVINGTTYAIPVKVIAKDRAAVIFAKGGEFDSLEQSLQLDTIPLFLEDDMEISDWAKNNMNWSDVIDSARIVSKNKLEKDPEEDWVNGQWFLNDTSQDSE